MWPRYESNNVWRDFTLSVSEFAMVARKVVMANFLQKLFSDRTFCVTITDADIGSLKSLHTSFDKYLDHMLVKFEKKMVRNVQNLDFFFLKKNGKPDLRKG